MPLIIEAAIGEGEFSDRQIAANALRADAIALGHGIGKTAADQGNGLAGLGHDDAGATPDRVARWQLRIEFREAVTTGHRRKGAARLDLVPVRVDRKPRGPRHDLRQRDRPEIPDIDADIDTVAAAPPIVMDMPEELQGTGEGQHRIVKQKQALAIDGHIGDVADTVPSQFADPDLVVIAEDEMFAAGDLTEDLRSRAAALPRPC